MILYMPPPSTTRRKSRIRYTSPLIMGGLVLVLMLGVGVAYYAGAFASLFAPDEPYRDPLLDTFEQRTISSQDASGESSFSVGEPGSLPPRTMATTSATTSEEVGTRSDPEDEPTPGEGADVME